MKNSEFIELLNLYLDHEISAADAARLEAEVQANPAHRRTYEQYCRMQKACSVLAKDFQKQAADNAAVVGDKIIAFEAAPRRNWAPALYATVGLAAAACVAFVVVARQSVKTTTGSTPALAAVTTSPEVLETKVLVSTMDVDATRAFTARTVSLGGRRNEANATSSVRSLALNDDTLFTQHDQLGWLNDVQFTPVHPVRADDLLSEAKRFRQTDPRTRDARNSTQGRVEMTAFKFQK